MKINCSLVFVGLDQDRVNSKNSILEIIQIQVLEHKLPFGEEVFAKMIVVEVGGGG